MRDRSGREARAEGTDRRREPRIARRKPRSWRSGTPKNKRKEETPCTDGDLFAERMYYNEANSSLGASAQFNGNISQVRWTALNRPVEAFGYQYDKLDRLTKAQYGRFTSAGNVVQSGRFNEQIWYDILGNITMLKRNGRGANNQTQYNMDNMTYGYDGGKLTGIIESGDQTRGYKGDGGHYYYDAMDERNGAAKRQKMSSGHF